MVSEGLRFNKNNGNSLVSKEAALQKKQKKKRKKKKELFCNNNSKPCQINQGHRLVGGQSRTKKVIKNRFQKKKWQRRRTCTSLSLSCPNDRSK
jgi:hypothetical protein